MKIKIIDNALSDSDLDICVNNFYQKLHIIIKDNVPLCQTKPISYPPWYDSELKSLVKQKRAAHASAGNDKYSAEYIKFKKELKSFDVLGSSIENI